MAVNIIDRWNLARNYLEKKLERENIKNLVRRNSDKVSTSLLSALRTNSPDGSRWEDTPDVFENRRRFLANVSPRPSLRKFGITLAQGWRKPRLDFKGSTQKIVRSSINFINVAPHTEWVIEGVDKTYDIPSTIQDYRMYFFWHRRNKPTALKQITHKGFAGNPFVDRVMAQAERLIDNFREDLVRDIENG